MIWNGYKCQTVSARCVNKQLVVVSYHLNELKMFAQVMQSVVNELKNEMNIKVNARSEKL